MTDQPAPIVNLLNKLTVADLRELSFNSDSGEKIKYSRLVLAGEIKGTEIELEIKVEKKEIAVLKALDIIPESILEPAQ